MPTAHVSHKAHYLGRLNKTDLYSHYSLVIWDFLSVPPFLVKSADDFREAHRHCKLPTF